MATSRKRKTPAKGKAAAKARTPAKIKPAAARGKAARPKAVRGKATRTNAAPASGTLGGPVTLEEARKLALATQPKARGAVRKAPPTAASPREVGAERRKLERARREEIARRIREYKATMAIMKRRGARPAEGQGRRRAPRRSFVPLQVFAEGDSWFDYPVPFFGGGIIPRLQEPAGRADPQSGHGRRRGSLHARRRTAQAARGASGRRLPGRRTVGRAAVLRWRQRHRRQSDGAVGARFRSHRAARGPHPYAALRRTRWRWSSRDTRTSSTCATGTVRPRTSCSTPTTSPSRTGGASATSVPGSNRPSRCASSRRPARRGSRS